MYIRKFRRIRKYLTYEAVKTLVQCTVTVRLDYCNSLYCGLPLKTIKKVQLAQNSVARLIAKISPRESNSHTLKNLYWLPVTKRCQYKLMVLTYKTLHGTTPVYICDMLILQRFPTGGGLEFSSRGKFCISHGGISSLPRFLKKYVQNETETILELMLCREKYRTN